MFRAFITALCLLLGASAALADGVSAPIGIGPIGQATTALKFAPSAVATYQGPGDIAGSQAKVWVGLRAYSAAKAGTKAINLCDNAGANCADILTSATTGALNNPGTLGANNCSTSGTCVIAIFYDQSGSNGCTGSIACDIKQTTNADRPTLNWNSGAPFAVFTGTPVTMSSAGSLLTAISQPCTISGVSQVTSVSGLQYMFSSSGGGMLSGYTTGPDVAQYAGSAIQTKATSLSTWLSTQAFYNGAASASSLEVNGSSSATSVGTNTYASAPALSWTAGYFIGQFREGGIWSGSITDPTTNQRSFWGF